MKKTLTCCCILLLLSAAASAQRRLSNIRLRASVTAADRIQLQRDFIRYRIVQRNVQRDGIFTLLEQKRLNQLKRKTRRDADRFRYHKRNRII